MEEHPDLQEWEFLPRVDDPQRHSPRSFHEDGGDAFGVITADYFVLGSGDGSVDGVEKGLSEPVALNLVDPDCASDQLITGGYEDSVEETVGGGVSLEKDMVLEDEVCYDEKNSDLSWLDSWGDEIDAVACVEKPVVMDEKVDEELEAGSDSVSSPKESEKGVDLVADGAEESNGVAWWKVPLELVKFCVFRMRPVWSVSVAVAMVGLVMLSRRLYRMRHASRRIPVPVGLHDKKALQIATAARLNEAFVVMRRVPTIRAPLPTTAVTPWPAMALRL